MMTIAFPEALVYRGLLGRLFLSWLVVILEQICFEGNYFRFHNV
jgi:hypothetical protein